MYQRPKSWDWGVISVGRSGMSVSLSLAMRSWAQRAAALSRLPVAGLKRASRVGDVLLPVYIVALREVRAEVAAAALLAAQRGARDQQADGHQAGQRGAARGRTGARVAGQRRAARHVVQLRAAAFAGRPRDARPGRRAATSGRAPRAAVGQRRARRSLDVQDRRVGRRSATRGVAPDPASPPRRARRTPAPRAASCWPAGWRRARRCTPPRRRRTASATDVRPSRSVSTPPIT